MTPRALRRGTMRRGRGTRSRFGMVLGIPVWVVLVALIGAGLLGLQLTASLQVSTTSQSFSAASAVDSSSGAGKNSSGLPVVTEMTVGTEVQRLVDTGSIQPKTSFNAGQCLREQGLDESILIMEEVAWGAEETQGWLLVHGPMDRDTLRANGGTVSATVVLPGCGADDDATADPASDRLWSGHVMIGSL
ncbi:hypothetical protein [Brachybacterium sp. YJGR34]|uniref:hypothetical protein n=1 Tax=Brachybacterium sp. YJGR34 TaxID=2059911 RepID=UPI000E0CAF35|nr:hypothetical protein [Brachybacterium sp. YJGR34]